jgi:hypothetical protein
MSALDKIRQAFPELANASDSEVLGEAARRTGASVAQLSDTLGIAPSGAFGEAARQLYTGLTVDAPRMAGQALKYYGDAGGERVGEGAFPRLGRATGLERQYGVEVTEPSPAYRAGQALVESAGIRGRGMDPDLRGRGLLGEAVITGARGLGGVAPALGLMALPGGQVLAPAVQAALFGGSSAQDTFEKLIEQGIPESEAAAAARRVWGVQGIGEGVATAGVGALMRPALAAVRGARTTEGVAKAATDTGVLRPFAKGMALNVPLQAGTEAAQDVGTSLIERSYGAAPEDLGDIARGSALAGAGMTLLLGPLALGGSVTRARRAQSLKDALYNPDTPVETRAKAMDLVMGEARRQGVAEQDVDTWFNQQLELEDARTEALRVAEQEEKTKQINLLGEKAQELEGLQGGVFSSLDQQRAFEQGLAGVQVDTPFASIDQQRAFTQGLETARDNNIARVGQQYQDLMGDRASTLMQAQDIGQQAQSVLEPQQRGLAAATQAGEQWQEVRAGQYRTMMDIDDMGQEWQKLSKELPQPVTGELSRAQKAALRGPEGKRFKPTSSPFVPTGQGPASTTLLEPVQNTLPSQLPAPTPAPSSLLSERPVEPVTPPGAADAVAAALPAAPVAAGVSSTPGAPSGTQASQTVKAETKKQAAPAIRIASTQTAEQQAKDDLGLTAALQVANRTKSTGNPLQASVEGAGKVSVPGKTSLNIKSLRDIRDALLNPSATVDGIGAKEQRIANAVRAFAKAYYKFSNAGGNMLRGIPSERGTRAENGEMVYKATKFAGQTPAQQRGQIKAKTGGQVNTLLKNLNTTRTALNELAAAVGGNAKDVEAIVKLVKDMVQQKLHTQVNDTGINEDFGQKETEREDGKDPTDIAFGKLDTMLSQGWNAAKANMFQGESDAMFVRQTAIRNSAEATAAGEGQSPLEKAAEGYAVFGKGESSDGLLGVMNYIQTHGTPFERTIAKAVFESMAYQDQPKLVFITDGKPRFDPKTNTVYIQRDASAAVTLHEALHSALQWYVYQNPDAPEVRALKAALKKVVAYKGPLNADAKRVQDLLKELVKGKKEIDAVLELVSYGNTLNDFRRALEAMESTETPKSFFDAASNVWQSILTAVQKMLGVKPTVASDVIANTFKLLEAAGQRGLKKGKPVGNALEATISTTTDAFKRWFGNSKVVDESGKPLVVYHGTDKDFKEFDLDKSGSGSGQYLGKGFYFAQSADTAAQFAGENSARVMPVYISIKNPFRTDRTDLTATQKQALRDDPKLGKHFKAAEAEGAEFSGWYTIQRAAVLSKDRANFIKSALELSGFDGIISGDLNEQPGMQSEVEIVAFRPEQIKSATGNRGTYDPASGNILEAAIQSDVSQINANPDRRGFLKFMGALGVGGVLPTTKAYAADLSSLARSGNIQNVIKHIAASSSNPAFRQLAKKLDVLGVGDIKLKVVDPGKSYSEGIPAALSSAYGIMRIDRANKTATVFIRGDVGLNEETLLHETIHAALASRYDVFQYYLANGKLQGKNADPAIKLYAAVWNEFEDAVRKAFPGDKIKNAPVGVREAMSNPDEFITYALTNEDLQKWMQGQRYEGKTLWGKFVEFAAGVLGFGKSQPTWLDAALRVSNNLLDAAVQDKGDFSTSSKIQGIIKSRTSEVRRVIDPASGNVLEAAIQSGDTPVVSGTAIPSKEADAITGQFQNPLTAEQYKKLSTTLLPEQISSKFLFDMFGWAKVPGKAEGAARKVSDYIQKNHTGAAKVASWVNSQFGQQSGVRDALIRAKDDKRGGSMIYNQIAQYFTSLPPQESVAVLEYMDAKLANLRKQGPAPAFPNNDTQMKDLADATITKWWEYARALRDPKQRDAYAGTEQPGGRWTGGVKFSQGLAFAESVDQLASASFGVRNISQLISSRTKNEVNDDAITFRTDANGDAVLDDKFVGMYLLTPALKKRLDNTRTTAEASQILAELLPDEFISSAKLTTDGKPMVNAEGVQLIPDRNYLWDLKEKEKGGYKFTARLDAKQALLVKKGRDLGHALQNTMAILANSYSANRLTEALVEYEAKTPNAVSFDTLDDLNAMLNGEYKGDKFVPNTEAASWTTRVKQNQVVKLSDSEAKSERVKGLFRNRNQWVQLPPTPTYGALAGKIVNGSVWSAIEDMSDRRPLVNSAVYNGTMRWFKKAKTVYNPATWGTNVASNFTMAMLDDIPLPTIGYAAKLYVGYMLPPAMASKLGISLSREQQQLMLEIMKTNALLGDFSSTELKQSIYDSMRSTIGDTEQGVAERVMQFAKMEKDRIEAIKKYAGKGADAAERADQLLGDWYSMQDNIFRVASMLNNLGQQSQAGKAIDGEAYRRAGDHARFAFLDYDIDSKAIRIMRQTAFPFISWPYAAAKMIGNVAVHKPWKLVNLYAGLWILDGLTQAITGDDDDELRESGPEWARNRMLFGMGPHTHIRVPFMGDSENPVYYDIGKYITPSSFGDRIPNAFLGLSWWPSFVSPGGPYISSAIALIGGVDPYTGRALSPPTADDWEKLSARLTYGQSLFAPNLPFLNARELTKAQEAFTATEGRSENYSSLYMARTAGLRLYDFNVQGALDQQDRAAAAIEREYKTEIGKLKRKMERLETPDWDEFFAREEELVRRMEERIAKVRGGQTEEE